MQTPSLWSGPPLWLLLSQGIDITTTHRDFGIVFDYQLKFHIHWLVLPIKLTKFLDWFKRCFEYLNFTMLTHLFSTLVQPILKYNNPIWGPHYIVDKKKVEKVQWRATHLLSQFHDKSYAERLTLLSSPSPHYEVI